MDIHPSQRKFMDKTSQPWESEVMGIPCLPVKGAWGSPWAMPPFDKGGHIMVTTSRFILCPKDMPAAWTFHFSDILSVSTEVKLVNARLGWTDYEGVEVRWDTLKKGAKAAHAAWREWRDYRSVMLHYPEVRTTPSSEGPRCGYCEAPVSESALARGRCFACYSALVQ